MHLIGTFFALIVLLIVAPILISAIRRKEKEIISRKIRTENEKILRRKEEIEEIARKESLEKERIQNTIYVSQFKEKLKKAAHLLKNGMYSPEEFENRKQEIISELADKKIECSYEDFMLEMISLKENEILDSKDLKSITALLDKNSNLS